MTAVETRPQTTVTSDPETVEQIVAAYLARDTEPVYLDTETTGFNPRTERLVMVQLRQGTRGQVVLDTRRREAELVPLLEPLFDGTLLVVGHNLKFDVQWLLSRGISGRGMRLHDTMIAEQVWLGGDDDEGELRVDLKSVAARYGVPGVSKEERNWFVGLDKRPAEWRAPFPAEQVEYGAQDVRVLAPIFEAQRKNLKRYDLAGAFAVEMRALPAIARMEHNGITIDVEGWRSFIAEKATEARGFEDQALSVFGKAILEARIARYDAELAEWRKAQDAEEREVERLREVHSHRDPIFDGTPGWGEFKKRGLELWRERHPMPAKPKLDTTPPNIGSPDQLVQAFRALGIEVPTKKDPKTREVKTTTESAALEKLAKADPRVAPLTSWRKAQKFVDSFGESLLEHGEPTEWSFEDEETGETRTLLGIHCDYQQIGAATGRMSCRKPNFQQIPSKGDGKKVRKLVRARPGHKLLTADLSNAELRVLAHLSGKGAMYDALAGGKDLHAETARIMFGLDGDPAVLEFKPGLTYRQVAKTINFGLVYGMSAFKFSMDTGIPQAEAERLIGLYFAAYPEVKRWLDKVAKEVHTTLHSRTLARRWRKYHTPGPAPVRPSGNPKPAAWRAYEDKKRAWDKAWAAIERRAKNTPIQGSNADIIKEALGLLDERLPDVARVVAVVHDEIVVEAPTFFAKKVAKLLGDSMKEAFEGYIDPALVPETEVKIADYWSK